MSVNIHKNLLLVEDNEALNEVLTEFLRSAGYSVAPFLCGEDVTSIHGFDIAVLDLNLPGEDGLSIAARIKAASPSTGIVLLTVRSQLDDKVKGYEVGADVFLPKPIDPVELLAVTNSLVRRLSQAAEAQGLSASSDTTKELSEREIGIIKLIAQGKSYAAIAEQLGVSMSTVQSHIRASYSKLGAHSKMEAVQVAKNRNLF